MKVVNIADLYLNWQFVIVGGKGILMFVYKCIRSVSQYEMVWPNIRILKPKSNVGDFL